MPADQRTKRLWPWIVVIATALIALVAPMIWLPGTSEARAATRADEYRTAISNLARELPAAHRAVSLVTDPAAGRETFGDVVLPLFRLEAAARRAEETADKALPSAWPLAPSAPFEELVPPRDLLAASAATAQSVVDDLVGVLNYRAAFGDILVIDPLPLIPPTNFRRFEARLVEESEKQNALFDDLPRPDILRDHRVRVGDAVERFAVWVDEYVHALWIGETPTAVTLLIEQRIARDGLRAALVHDLAGIAISSDIELVELGERLDDALVILDTRERPGG